MHEKSWKGLNWISNVLKSISFFYILEIGDPFSRPILFAIGRKNWKNMG
jgi:hypothetical protein